MTALQDDPRVARGMQRQVAARRELLAAGATPIGWKLGLGAPAALERFSISAPAVGFLTDRSRLHPDAAVSLGDWASPVAEPELAVYVGSDVGAGADRSAVAAAIAGLGIAIELADLGAGSPELEDVLAGDIFHRAVVFGPQRASADVGALRATITHAGKTRTLADPLELVGDPVDALAHVADQVATFGEIVRAGDVLITGSLIAPPVTVAPGDLLEYELVPLGGMALEFVA